LNRASTLDLRAFSCPCGLSVEPGRFKDRAGVADHDLVRWVIIKTVRRPHAELEAIADEAAAILGEDTGIRVEDELTGEVLYTRGAPPSSDGVLLAEISPSSSD
jgi:hypothetical protein